MIKKMRKIEKDIINGNIAQQLFIFFIPVLLTYLFQQLYNTIDAIIVGKYLGKAALGAVGGATGTAISLILDFILGLSSGVTILVAQFYGRRDNISVEKTVKTGFYMAFVFGMVMTVLGILITPGLLNLLNVPYDMYDLSCIYMQVYLAGLIPTLVYNIGASILRAIGDSRTPLIYLVASSIINIILDFVFIKYIKLGVFGAALATSLSQVISAILVLKHFAGITDCYHYSLKYFGYDPDILIKTITLGLPAAIQSVVYSVTNLYIQATVNGFGTTTVAAYAAYNKVDGFFWRFSNAFGISISTIVGQNYGADKKDRVIKTVYTSAIMYVVLCLPIILTCYRFAEPFICLFTNDAGVIKIGVEIMHFFAPIWILFMPIEVLSSSIKACGDSFSSMVICMLGIAVVRIVYITFVPYEGLLGVLRSYPISWLITSTVFVYYAQRGKWLKKSL